MINGKHPVVMRMAGMSPGDLGGYEAHRRRRGGDLGHVDDARSGLNRRLIGKADWAQRAAEEVEAMRLENFARELESLERRRRSAEVRKRLAEGPRDPWRATRHGPMREIVLTANRDWFEETDDPGIAFNRDEQERRERAFEARAVAWLRASFGDDVIHARADRDEEAYHIHAVILPRAQTRDGRRMLQPSIHPMIKNYEEAQDSVGAWFAPLGLVRGEKRAEATRNAAIHNAQVRAGDVEGPEVEVPRKRLHNSPRTWREAKEREAAARDKTLARRETRVAAASEAVAAREIAVRGREVRVERRRRKAVEVMQVARQVARQQRPSAAPKAAAAGLARRLFERALRRLRAQAQAEIADDIRQIRAADDAILAVARKLPPAERKAVAEARKPLSGRLLGLERAADRRAPGDPGREGR